MNNASFRSLVAQHSASQDTSSSNTTNKASSFTPRSIGQRNRTSTPRTPRYDTGHDAHSILSRQGSSVDPERRSDRPPPAKKHKSYDPKGSRLAKGYTDRASQLREGTGLERSVDGAESKEQRLKALEELFKLQQIDQDTFDRQKEALGIGGSVDSTHLVKGLDWKLLERVRRGEDVSKPAEKEVDVQVGDEDFDRLLDQDVVERSRADKVSSKVGVEHDQDEEVPQGLPQVAMSRDAILKRLKAQRMRSSDAAATGPGASIPPEARLGDKFKKIAAREKPKKHKFIEVVNGRRREVLIITHRDGSTKRKTRWIDDEDIPTKEQEVMGMDIPGSVLARQQALEQLNTGVEDEDDDIFAGVGTDYNPLADLDSDGDGLELDETKKQRPATHTSDTVVPDAKASPHRNYFGEQTKGPAGPDRQTPMVNDPTLMAALKRAAQLRKGEERGGDGDDGDVPRSEREKQFLDQLKRRDQQDAADLDYGFGESRFGDDDDDGDGEVIYEGEEGKGGEKQKRKRGPKKRKGDKNKADDVLRVLAGRS